MQFGILSAIIDRRLVPDPIMRAALRLHVGRQATRRARSYDAAALLARLEQEPIFSEPDTVNRQLYELPADFFRLLLGPRMKFSCCLFEHPGATLAEAEEAMLRVTCERARVEDGMEVLDLGCGWGALSLYLAERYPNASITGITNSTVQCAYIEERARGMGLTNVRVLHQDASTLDHQAAYDRVLGVEVLDHARNCRGLLALVRQALRPDGLAFFHHACHQHMAYVIEEESDADWIARHFAAGCTMFSYRFLDHFDDQFAVIDSWRVDGAHFARSFETWRNRLLTHRTEAREVFARYHPPREAAVRVNRWLTYLMACGMSFGVGGEDAFFIAHHLLEPVARPVALPTGCP